MTKVGLMGFGKTGRAVASVLLESEDVALKWVVRRSQSTLKTSISEHLGINTQEPVSLFCSQTISVDDLLDQSPVDVIVDFSSSDGLEYYAQAAAARGVTIASAVSQYSPQQLDRLKQCAESTVVMHSPNITLGINFLLMAAKILQEIAPFTDVEIVEEHFKSKPEVSGTAKVIAQTLDVDADETKSIRAGGIIGAHEILFGFPYQTVRLKHESISREAFGNGILFAISHLRGKPIGFYSMQDLLQPLFLKHLEVQAWK